MTRVPPKCQPLSVTRTWCGFYISKIYRLLPPGGNNHYITEVSLHVQSTLDWSPLLQLDAANHPSCLSFHLLTSSLYLHSNFTGGDLPQSAINVSCFKHVLIIVFQNTFIFLAKKKNEVARNSPHFLPTLYMGIDYKLQLEADSIIFSLIKKR